MIFNDLVRVWVERFDQFDRRSHAAELAGHLIAYLESGPDHLGYLLDICGWNLGRLATGEQWRTHRKPRIDVRVLVTSKGNLALEWAPRGRWKLPYYVDRIPSDWDFLRFQETPAGYGVPVNRLVHLRDFGALIRQPSRDSPVRIEDAHLLQATDQYLGQVVGLLKHAFDVEMTHELEILHGPAGKRDPFGPVTGARIVDVEERKLERVRAEAAAWARDQFEPVGLTVDQFAVAARKCQRSAAKTAKELQMLTAKPVTLAMARRWIDGYERRHGKLRDEPRAANILPFPKREEPTGR